MTTTDPRVEEEVLPGDADAPDDVDSADLVPTDDGIEDFWGSGHVSGPFDPDEVALIEQAHEGDDA